MSDAEMLDLAAKAMGLKYMNGALWDGRDVVEYSWNPLEDDGHALRLAVKLEVMLDYIEKGYMAGHVVAVSSGASAYEPLDSDSYAATRRAIVRAAAEIGKGMK